MFSCLLVAVALLLPSIANAQSPTPTLSIYLEQWGSTFSQNIICVSPTCMGPNSTLPNRKTIESNFQRFSANSTNKDRTTINTSSPAYHTTTIIEEQFVTTGTSSAGFMTITTDYGSGSTTTSTTPITGLNVGETMTHGSLAVNITDSVSVNQQRQSDVSQTILEVNGGVAGWEYTYSLPFQVVEKTWNASGALVTVGTVPCSQVSFPAFPQATKSGCALLFKVVGGVGLQEIDVTPSCSRPYYEYSFSAPVLISSRKVDAN